MKNLLVIFTLMVLASFARAQSADEVRPPRKWLECDVDWIISGDEKVGPDFSLEISFDDGPLTGARIELEHDGKVVATAKTDSRGLAHFTAIPPGEYSPRPAGGLGFPRASQDIEVVRNHGSGKKVKLRWPASSISVRALSGRLSTSEELDGPSTPLHGAKVELLDLRTGRLIETAETDMDGSYNFSELRRGLYDLRVTPPVPLERGKILSRELAIQLDASGKHGMIPELKVMQSECAGVQLFLRTINGDWDAQ